MIRNRILKSGLMGAFLAGSLSVAVGAPIVVSAAGSSTVATSGSSQAFQRSAQDKVAYLHDGSLLVGYYDSTLPNYGAYINHVTSPSTTPVSQNELYIPNGDQATIYTLPGSGSTDIWIEVGNELSGGSALEQIRHGTYNGSAFQWDTLTEIPGALTGGRQDPSVTWTGKWLIASWWDDIAGGDSDNVFYNWTTDKTGMTGWLASAELLTTTFPNSIQVSLRHSAKLGATIAVYGSHCEILTRTLLDGATDPSPANWTTESAVDPQMDDCEGNFGGPQIAVDERTGKIHVFRAVTSSNAPNWSGITYWLGTPDATPMSTGHVSWSSRLVIDNTGVTATDPPDITGAVDSTGKVYVVWATSVAGGLIKYVTLTSPYTSASAPVTVATTGANPRYPHIPAQLPLTRGYLPLFYQSGTGPYDIILDTTYDIGPPTVPTGLSATGTATPSVVLNWTASTDNVGVTGYTIYRGGTKLTTVGGSTLTYTDTTVARLTTYSYTVDAFDAAGNHSAQSAAVQISITMGTTLTGKPLAGDFSGDGKADVAIVTSAGVAVAVSTGSAFSTPSTWAAFPFYGSVATLAGDVTGEGKADLVAVNAGQTFVLPSTGTGFGAPSGWSNIAFYGTRGTFLADVNGDGKADMVAVNNTSVWVMFSTGTVFGPPLPWSSTPFYGNLSTQIGDVSGDGKADLIAINSTSVWVMKSTGSGFGSPAQWSGTPFYGNVQTMLVDANGDGKVDLVALNSTSTWIITSTGSGFGPPTQWSNTPFYGLLGTLSGDVNGDHKVDLVAINSTSVWVARSTGAALSAPELWL
jgi:FG-GAP-like repeat